MSDYTQSTFFAPKDLLATGNPNKIIYGSDVDAELSAISTAIATKADVNGDAIGAGTPCTELSVDNLKLDGNKIISTNTDGDIELEPDGTGSVVITKVDIAAGEIDGTPIGANSASTGAFTTLTASDDANFDSGTLFVDASTNRVGVGTINPASLLTIQDATPVFEIDSTTTSNTATIQFTSSGTVDSKITHVGNTGVMTIDSGRNSSWGGKIAFVTDTEERMRIDDSGNVGYNGKLFSSNDLTTLGGLQLYRDHATGSCYLFDTTAAPFSGPLIFGTNNAEAMRIDSSGRVGIGTNNPSRLLDIATSNAGGSTLVSLVSATDGNCQLLFGDTSSDTQGKVVYNNSGDYMALETNGSERVRIDSSGNLLVGSSSSSTTSGEGSKFLSNGRLFQVSSYSTSAQESLAMWSTGAATYRFYVDWGGTVHATSASISAISDQRLKENIRDLDAGLDEVLALKPRKFDWKEGKGANTKDARGFIAQEFEEVFPDLIDEWKDPAPEGGEPYKTVRQDLIPVLVKAIQEQQEIIEDLRARVAALEA